MWGPPVSSTRAPPAHGRHQSHRRLLGPPPSPGHLRGRGRSDPGGAAGQAQVGLGEGGGGHKWVRGRGRCAVQLQSWFLPSLLQCHAGDPGAHPPSGCGEDQRSPAGSLPGRPLPHTAWGRYVVGPSHIQPGAGMW